MLQGLVLLSIKDTYNMLCITSHLIVDTNHGVWQLFQTGVEELWSDLAILLPMQRSQFPALWSLHSPFPTSAGKRPKCHKSIYYARVTCSVGFDFGKALYTCLWSSLQGNTRTKFGSGSSFLQFLYTCHKPFLNMLNLSPIIPISFFNSDDFLHICK